MNADSHSEKPNAKRQTIENPPIRKVENFIPLRHTDLILRLQDSMNVSERETKAFKDLCERLTAIFHIEHLSTLMKVEDLYAPLDPDSDAVEVYELSDEERDQRIEDSFVRITQILYSAHYHRLDRNELRHAIDVGYAWGVKLDVDIEVFERLEIFARGWRTVTKTRRRWQNLFRQESIEMPEFHRLVIAFRLKETARVDDSMSTDVVYLKMFKNIPETDLEILLPGSKVKLSMLDQGKILVPNLSSAAMTVFKIFRVGVFLTIVAAAWIIKWVLAIAVLVGYVTKAVFSYFSTKNKYQFGLTKSLYLKNMDNNAGVIYRLFNEAEEQELCEAILAYAVLWKHGQHDGMTDLQVDKRCESFLEEIVNFQVDFEVHDALGKLARLGLATVDKAGRWSAIPVRTAPQRLHENWQKIFSWEKLDSDDLFTI
jgi:hypothetical protein